jgi:hypothetical protein
MGTVWRYSDKGNNVVLIFEFLNIYFNGGRYYKLNVVYSIV